MPLQEKDPLTPKPSGGFIQDTTLHLRVSIVSKAFSNFLAIKVEPTGKVDFVGGTDNSVIRRLEVSSPALTPINARGGHEVWATPRDFRENVGEVWAALARRKRVR